MSQEKLRTLAHYVCWKCGDPTKLGATKLNKVLWLSDVMSYRINGSAITGTPYVKRQYGPVPKYIMPARRDLVSQKKVLERNDSISGLPGIHFIALEKPDVSVFSPRELALIDSIIDEVCELHTATSISSVSHDVVWEAARIGEEIPYSAWLASTPGQLTEDDFAWGDKVIAEIEGHDAAAS